jgi:hypothetical protein
MEATPNRAHSGRPAKADSLRSLRAGAIWTAIPARDQHLLLWLLAADIVTAQLAALLVYGQLRIAQRRLSRLVELSLLRGFWTAGAQRPRGRYAYSLTRASRLEIERLAWPGGRPDRPPELPASAPVHQLATHDLLAAFLRAGNPAIGEGIVVWVPERACAQLFGGFLRPDALAGIRVGDRALTLFVERDLGTERGEVIAEKIRRYRSVLSRTPDAPAAVGFVVESERRGHTIAGLASRHPRDRGLPILTVVDERLRSDPLGTRWRNGEAKRSIREVAAGLAPVDWQILRPGCLSEVDTIACLDDRGIAMLPDLGLPSDHR